MNWYKTHQVKDPGFTISNIKEILSPEFTWRVLTLKVTLIETQHTHIILTKSKVMLLPCVVMTMCVLKSWVMDALTDYSPTHILIPPFSLCTSRTEASWSKSLAWINFHSRISRSWLLSSSNSNDDTRYDVLLVCESLIRSICVAMGNSVASSWFTCAVSPCIGRLEETSIGCPLEVTMWERKAWHPLSTKCWALWKSLRLPLQPYLYLNVALSLHERQN